MASIVQLTTRTDKRGNLTVLDQELPFLVKRAFFVYDVPTSVERGGHAHKKTRQVAICVAGACTFNIDDGKSRNSFRLDRPDRCLILEPQDWHTMSNFEKDTVLLVLASESYDPEDYILEAPAGPATGEDLA